jgi:hypothetical protein
MRIYLILGLSSLVAIAAFSSACSTIAQWAAPAKPVDTSKPEGFEELEKDFWKALHGGDYEAIPKLLTRYKALYVAHPGHPIVAAHTGFLHVWRLSERRRLKQISPEVIDDAALCHKYFREAHLLAPEDARFAGFHAACIMSEADIDKDERNTRRGYFAMHDAYKQWPEFNAFTAGYVLSNQDWKSDLFEEAVEFQWKNLDVCIGGKIDREKPDYSSYMKLEVKEGSKRACWNSWIAPHNFEGFFLNMGDMLVKQGKINQARQIYANAKLSKDYASWPFKAVLEKRIEDAEKNQAWFQKPVQNADNPDHPVILFNTAYSCMACHQSSATQ